MLTMEGEKVANFPLNRSQRMDANICKIEHVVNRKKSSKKKPCRECVTMHVHVFLYNVFLRILV